MPVQMRAEGFMEPVCLNSKLMKAARAAVQVQVGHPGTFLSP